MIPADVQADVSEVSTLIDLLLMWREDVLETVRDVQPILAV